MGSPLASDYPECSHFIGLLESPGKSSIPVYPGEIPASLVSLGKRVLEASQGWWEGFAMGQLQLNVKDFFYGSHRVGENSHRGFRAVAFEMPIKHLEGFLLGHCQRW